MLLELSHIEGFWWPLLKVICYQPSFRAGRRAVNSHKTWCPPILEYFCGSQEDWGQDGTRGFTHHFGHCGSPVLPRFSSCMQRLSQMPCCTSVHLFLWRKVSNLINAEFELVKKQELSLSDNADPVPFSKLSSWLVWLLAWIHLACYNKEEPGVTWIQSQPLLLSTV